MGEGDKINLSCRRILNNLCRYSALKEKHNSPLLKCGYAVTSFQRGQCGKREIKSSFTVDKTDKLVSVL